MDRTVNHEDVVALLGVYAVDAVDPDEAAAVEAHVARCPRCAAELAQHHEVTALLGNTGGDASAELWDKIAARLDPPGEPPAEGVVMHAALADALPRQMWRRRRRARWSALAAVAGLAAGLIALLALQVGHLHHQLEKPTLSAAARAAMAAPGARTVTLADPTAPATALASVVVLPSGTGYVVNHALPALGHGRTYQLWVLRRGRPVSLGLLGSHPATVAFAQGGGSQLVTYAVTPEPAGGVVSPTHAPVAESVPVRT